MFSQYAFRKFFATKILTGKWIKRKLVNEHVLRKQSSCGYLLPERFTDTFYSTITKHFGEENRFTRNKELTGFVLEIAAIYFVLIRKKKGLLLSTEFIWCTFLPRCSRSTRWVIRHLATITVCQLYRRRLQSLLLQINRKNEKTSWSPFQNFWIPRAKML